MMWGANVRGLDLGIQDEPIELDPERHRHRRFKFDLLQPGCGGAGHGPGSFFQYTRSVMALRAVADDHQAALVDRHSAAEHLGESSGRSPVRRAGGRPALGARNGVQFALVFVALKALPVLILGGFTSVGARVPSSAA